MKDYFNWMMKPLEPAQIEKYLVINNIIIQKTELFLDIFSSLHKIIEDTYLGSHGNASAQNDVDYSDEDINNHFEWCWNKMINNFNSEGVYIDVEGEHKEYLKVFFQDSFYNQKDSNVRESIDFFFNTVFNIEKLQTGADLEILKEMYNMMDKHIEFDKKIKHAS